MLAPTEPDTSQLITSLETPGEDGVAALPPIFQGSMQHDDDMAIESVEFYTRDPVWSTAVYAAYLCSGGLVALLARWIPVRRLKLTHTQCDAASADSVLICCSDGRLTVAKLVRDCDANLPPYFEFRLVRHFLHLDEPPAPAVFQTRLPLATYHQRAIKGLTQDDVVARQHVAGTNLIAVPVKPYPVLLVEEILNPFYVFQVWSVTVWMLDGYVYYAICVALISVTSALISLVSTRRSLQRIRDMAYDQADICVRRNGAPLVVSTQDLVPGDVVVLAPQDTVPADLVLLSGSVIVDESMLTGESVPVAKTALPSAPAADKEGEQAHFCFEIYKGSVLLCGTKVVETSAATGGGSAAMVIRTGFLTAKGGLVRSILFPKETSNDFFRDAVRFICAMAALASVGMVYQSLAMMRYGAELKHIILTACDIVTIAVPPALPAAICIGLEMSMRRLRRLCIYCTSPSRINPAGQLDLVCFDKTGTLTTDRIDVVGYVAPCAVLEAEEAGRAMTDTAAGDAPVRGRGPHHVLGRLLGVQEIGWHLLSCLALCHSLVPAPMTSRPRAPPGSADMEDMEAGPKDDTRELYIGDPLEVAMFAATKASLREGPVRTSGGQALLVPIVAFECASEVRQAAQGQDDMCGRGVVANGCESGGDRGHDLCVLDGVATEEAATVVRGNDREVDGRDSKGHVASRTGGDGREQDARIQGWQQGRAETESRAQGPRRVTERAAVLRRFAFTSESFRSSVIVAYENVAGTFVYVKGAPEAVLDCCDASTVPPNLLEHVTHHTRNGRRVLACAYRACGAVGAVWALQAERVEVEAKLVWAGLIVMENTLKPDSKPAVDQLVAAGLHCAMVTGDHALTAISVARRCGILVPERVVLLGEVVAQAEDGQEECEGGQIVDQMGDLPQRLGQLIFSEVPVLPEDLARSGVEIGKGVVTLSALRTRVGGHASDADRGAQEEAPGASKSRRRQMSLSEAHSRMEDEGVEVAITGSALDVLLRLSTEGDAAQASPERGTPLDPAEHGGMSSLVRSMRRGSDWWSTRQGAKAGKRRRSWGPPGLSRSRRREAGKRGPTIGLPTQTPPSSPQNAPATPSVGPVLLSPLQNPFSCAHAAACNAGEAMDQEMAADVLHGARVFARCSPMHKQLLVSSLAVNMPATVAFCGDGANDCGALKAAHVGLSLSNAESSIAAPFTSSTKSVHAMVDLVREGRAALVSSVASFKFMAMYSLTQLISVLRLYQVNATLTDGMFLWVDLFLVLPFVVTMSQTSAATSLSRLRPQGRLVSPAVLASIIGQVFLVILVQMLGARAARQMALFDCDPLCLPLLINGTAAADKASVAQAGEGGQICWNGTGAIAACCLRQPLGCPTHAIHPNPKVNSLSVEATAAFLLSQFQYLAAVVALSTGAPYRLPAHTNRWLCFNLAVAVFVCLVLTFAVDGGGLFGVADWMRLVAFPDPDFPGRLLLIAMAGVGAACALESLITHIDDLLAGEGGAITGGEGGEAIVAAAGAEGRVNFHTCVPRVRASWQLISRGQHLGQLWKITCSAGLLAVCAFAAVAMALSLRTQGQHADGSSVGGGAG